MMINVIRWVVIGLAILGLGLSSWIVVPAPTMTLLPLAVVAPEISPLLWSGNGAIAIITFILLWLNDGWLSHGWLNDGWFIAVGCSIVGICLSSIPLWQLTMTIQQTQTRLEVGLGENYGDRIPVLLQQQMRPRPFVLEDLVRGIPLPSVAQQSTIIPTADGSTHVIDIYRPTLIPQERKLPLIVTIYGGAWQVGKPEDTAAFSRYMAAQGYSVAAIAYRHAPDYQFPAQLEDVQASLRWLIDHSADYQIDPTRLALVGWSSGAHLAMLAAYHPDTPPVQAVVNYYGPVDLIQGYRDLPNPDPIDARSVLEAFLGGNPTEYPKRYQTASPLHWVRSGLPPTLSLYGDRDHLVKPIFGQQLDQKLKASDNISILVQLPWAEHAFNRVWQGMSNQIALYAVERFLAHTLIPYSRLIL